MDQLFDRGRALMRRSLDDDLVGLSAELAYRFLFALFPFMIFLSALGGFVASWLGIPDPASQVLDTAGSDLPPELVATIRPELESVLGSTDPGLLSFGAVAALWAATGGTNALIKAMNRAYGVEDTRGFVQRYLVALGLTICAVGGIVGSFVVIAGGALLTAELVAPWGIGSVLWTAIEILRYPVVLALLIVAVAALYRFAPAVRAPWRVALVGATVFAVGWVVATAAFSMYVARFGSYASTYGSFAGVIVLMLWFYLSAVVLLIGAELVAILRPAAERGSEPQAATEEVDRGAVVPDHEAPDGPTSGPPRRARPNRPMMLPLALVGIATAVGAFLGAASERLLPRDE